MAILLLRECSLKALSLPVAEIPNLRLNESQLQGTRYWLEERLAECPLRPISLFVQVHDLEVVGLPNGWPLKEELFIWAQVDFKVVPLLTHTTRQVQ